MTKRKAKEDPMDDVLRRMLAMPPEPHKPPAKKTAKPKKKKPAA